MALVFKAPFAQVSKQATVVITAAYDNVNDDSPSSVSALITAGTDGALVTKIQAMPRATVALTPLGLWFSPDGTEMRIMDQVLMAAHTVATTTAIPKTKFLDYTEALPGRMQSGEQIFAGIGVALTEGICFYAEWNNF